jgi:hypothetical protein
VNPDAPRGEEVKEVDGEEGDGEEGDGAQGRHTRRAEEGGSHTRRAEEGGSHTRRAEEGGSHTRRAEEGGSHTRRAKEGGTVAGYLSSGSRSNRAAGRLPSSRGKPARRLSAFDRTFFSSRGPDPATR